MLLTEILRLILVKTLKQAVMFPAVCLGKRNVFTAPFTFSNLSLCKMCDLLSGVAGQKLILPTRFSNKKGGSNSFGDFYLVLVQCKKKLNC